jgi:hypothetical protein|nr:MAG TPA: hypothetical protein [Caudoviricetes sp.]
MESENYYEVFTNVNHAASKPYVVEMAFSLEEAHETLKGMKSRVCGKRPRKFKGTYADDEDAPLVNFEIVRVIDGCAEEDATYQTDWYHALRK